jgi:hypothetical protein
VGIGCGARSLAPGAGTFEPRVSHREKPLNNRYKYAVCAHLQLIFSHSTERTPPAARSEARTSTAADTPPVLFASSGVVQFAEQSFCLRRDRLVDYCLFSSSKNVVPMLGTRISLCCHPCRDPQSRAATKSLLLLLLLLVITAEHFKYE